MGPRPNPTPAALLGPHPGYARRQVPLRRTAGYRHLLRGAEEHDITHRHRNAVGRAAFAGIRSAGDALHAPDGG